MSVPLFRPAAVLLSRAGASVYPEEEQEIRQGQTTETRSETSTKQTMNVFLQNMIYTSMSVSTLSGI